MHKRYTLDIMQESSRYAVGIDVGTTAVRCVVARIDEETGKPSVVGLGKSSNRGMRKGTVVDLSGPAEAIDNALGEAERMSGYQIDEACLSVNGSHIVSTHVDGMVAVGDGGHEITHEDVLRVEEVATMGKIPPNREVLDVIPHAYKLDGQDNIRDPIGMTGTRLEIDAHVVSALTPHVNNLQHAAESAKVQPSSIVLAGVASARAVLSEEQKENGVALVDIGGATTNVAVYEEGDLRYAAVVPMGGINITNDLAIGLKTDPSIAEKIKIKHASAVVRSENSGVSLKHDGEILSFNTEEIDDIVEARLEEIFEAVEKELKRAGRAGRLPGGIVLTGGTSNLSHIDDYAKRALGLAARVGKTTGFKSVVDDIEGPEYAAALGLMLFDSESHGTSGKKKDNKQKQKGSNPLAKFVSRFRV